MKFATRRTVYTDLNNYCHMAKPDEVIEVCEWTNGEGWDVALSNRAFHLTHGELQAILMLCNTAHPKESK
jgi:aspartate/glutamate racemase